jgi:putative endopeptidase
VYVGEFLPPGTKDKLMAIGISIREVFADHIRGLDWMGEQTKARALEKLGKIDFKVGYPDHWPDMSTLQVGRNSYCDNIRRAKTWRYNKMINMLGKPVDRAEWSAYPQTKNAYYNASNNEIIFPACNILVPGFEDRMADDAVLYGIIGSLFGHELTHGFGDEGSQYDANGNLINWWTPDDRAGFIAKTKQLVDQFNAYKIDTMQVNGELTIGENIADLGGVVMSYEAFKKTAQYRNNIIVSGLTPSQRYFLAFAYAWMRATKNGYVAELMMTDAHAPNEFRVNGPLSNMPEFYKAFGVQAGDGMYKADSLRLVIW